MKIRIVIPVHSQVEYVKQCVESLLKSVVDKSLKLDIVLVDDASDIITKGYLDNINGTSSINHTVKVVTNEKNMGFSFSVNRGIQEQPLDSEYVLILNSDTIVPKNLIERMIQGMMADSDIGILGPCSNYAGGRQGVNVEYDIKELDTFANEFYAQRKGREIVSIVVGLCMLVKREVFEKIGYFDHETFGLGLWEDTDFCLRARNMGYKCAVDMGCFVHHYGGRSFASSAAQQRILFLVNRKKFFDKWAKIYRVGEKKRIVGMLRVKDGEPWVQKSMAACSRFCDRIVVLVGKDSVDNTYNICKSFPNTTVEYGGDGYNETRDRNQLLQMALKENPEWCYLMDHDEIPEEKIIHKIQDLVNNPDPIVDGVVFKICHFWNDDKHIRMDGLWGGFAQCRLYRARAFDKIADVQIHSGSHPYIPPESLMFSYMRIKHYGNMDSEERALKYKRYTEVDTVKDVNMILGGYQQYYKQLYGKDQLDGADYYRHIVDETGLQLEEWIEDNGISLCMMVHNESEWVDRMLKSYNFRLLLDEIIICDNGSTDNLREVLKKYKIDKILSPNPDWLNEDGDLINYSAARNLTISEATHRWILQLDPDELVPPENVSQIFLMTLNQNIDVFLFPIKNIQELATDGMSPGRSVLSETVRLYKNSPYIYYTGLIHETIDESLIIMDKTIRPVVRGRAPFELVHMGYLRNKEDLAKKHEKYKRLLIRQLEKNPKDARLRYSLAIHYLHTGFTEMAVSEYERAVKDDPNYYMPYNDLGIIYARSGRIDVAMQYFRKAYDLISADGGIHPLYKDKIKSNLDLSIQIVQAMNRFSFITG